MQLDVSCDETLHIFWRAGRGLDTALSQLRLQRGIGTNSASES